MSHQDRALTPVRDSHCFCCGEDNERGLQLRFAYPRSGSAATELAVPVHFSGWRGVTHGGLLAMVLDETMAHACLSAGRNAFTAEMTVRFRQPLPVGALVRVSGQVERSRARIVDTAATVQLADGTVVAEASGRYLAGAPAPATAAG